MKVLVACECSGVVREAFKAKGHYALSCDLEETEIPGDHYKGDVKDVLRENWDLIIAHPPCDYLTVSGNRWYSDRPDLFIPAYKFATMFFDYAPRVCVENPVGRLSSLFRKPDQYVQPWQFGHDASKKTGLWLQNLPKLQPTDIVKGRMVKGKERWSNQTDSGQNKLGPSDTRKTDRSRTYQGIAEAMADQWNFWV